MTSPLSTKNLHTRTLASPARQYFQNEYYYLISIHQQFGYNLGKSNDFASND